MMTCEICHFVKILSDLLVNACFLLCCYVVDKGFCYYFVVIGVFWVVAVSCLQV